MVNPVLQTSIDQVMSTPTPPNTMFTISVQFQSSSDASYNYTPDIIDKIEQAQCPVTMSSHPAQYTDVIYLEWKISSAAYATLYDHSQDLLATVTRTYMDRFGNIDKTQAPDVRQYRAAIIDPRDVRRQITDAHLRTTPDQHIKVRLVEKEVYTIRKVGIHGIYHNTTMAGVISDIAANLLKIPKLHLVAPDNTHVYQHVVIPPDKDISEIFTYLQSRFGVYMKGLCYYYSESTLYIYPQYETNPQMLDYSALIYQAPQNAYAGANFHHIASGNQTSIVATGSTVTRDASASGSENTGTALMFLRSSQIVDGYVDMDPDKGPSIADNVGATIRLNSPRTLEGGSQNSSYAKATDNPFELSSKLARHQCTFVRMEWKNAIPYQLKPGHPVQYYYDHDGTMMKQTGIVDGVHMIMAPTDRVNGILVYPCKAWVQLRLSPDSVAVA